NAGNVVGHVGVGVEDVYLNGQPRLVGGDGDVALEVAGGAVELKLVNHVLGEQLAVDLGHVAAQQNAGALGQAKIGTRGADEDEHRGPIDRRLRLAEVISAAGCDQ